MDGGHPLDVQPRSVDLREVAQYYWYVLRRRHLTLLATFLVVLVSTWIYAHYRSPRYSANATVLIEPVVASVADPREPAVLDTSREYLVFQQQTIRSYAVARKACEALGLAMGENGPGAVDPVEEFRGSIEVEPVKQSRLVRITVTDAQPKEAARRANTVARVFIEHTLQSRRDASKDAYLWLSEQITVLRAQVARSEEAVLRFNEQEDVMSLEKRQTLIEERLADLNGRHTQSVIRRMELETALGEVERVKQEPHLAESLPQAVQNQTLQQTKAGLAKLEGELAQLSLKYKPKHPAVIRVEAQIEVLRQQLAKELNTVVRSIEIEHRLARANETTIAVSLAGLKAESQHLAQLGIQLNALKREAESNRQMYDVLLKRLNATDIDSNVGVSNVRLVDEARIPAAPVSSPLGNPFLMGLLGLALGAAFCLAVEAFDSSVRDESDIVLYMESTLLGMIPHARDKRDAEAVRLAFRNIRTRLVAYAQERTLGSLLVTSSLEGEGKTTSVLRLGEAFARAGKRVVLMDLDVFRPALRQQLGLDGSAGIAELLRGEAELDDVINPTQVPNLSAVPTGRTAGNPGELLSAPGLSEVIEQLKQRFDLVLADAPPLTAALEIGSLGKVMDGTVLVVQAGRTPRGMARRMARELRRLQNNLVGVVLRSTELGGEDVSGYYRYYHSYGEEQRAR